MNCPIPECGVWTRVLETRTLKDNTKRRTIECANLHRFRTLETIVEMPLPIIKNKGTNNDQRRTDSVAQNVQRRPVID